MPRLGPCLPLCGGPPASLQAVQTAVGNVCDFGLRGCQGKIARVKEAWQFLLSLVDLTKPHRRASYEIRAGTSHACEAELCSRIQGAAYLHISGPLPTGRGEVHVPPTQDAGLSWGVQICEDATKGEGVALLGASATKGLQVKAHHKMQSWVRH